MDDPHKAKCALCTRRAGKSHGLAAYHCINMLRGGNGAYIAPTAKQARRIMWNGRAGLKALARRFKLTLADSPYGMEFNNVEIIATLRGNGANTILGGAETRDDAEKYRGEPYALVTIDEPASFKDHLDYLVDEVLEPTLLDEDGTIVLAGTPGRVLAGKFYEITTGQRPATNPDEDDEDLKLADWAIHRWSVFNNTYLKNAARFLARVFRRHGWDPDNPPPRAQREYEGKWVRESETLCYPYSEKNLADSLPPGIEWRYIKGLDLGIMAIQVVAYSLNHPIVFFVEGWKENVGLTALASKMKSFDVRYPNTLWVGDYGALGKQIIEEFNQRHKFGIKRAEKTDKAAFMEALSDDLKAARAQVLRGNPILAEWDVLQWAEATGDLKQDAKRQEDPRFENHLSDAGLYAWREAKHWAYQRPTPEVVQGTPEWYKAQEQALYDKAMERYKTKTEGDWVERGVKGMR